MAKFFGPIGFSKQENESGVVTEKFVEKKYKGELTKNKKRIENGSNINDNVSLSNELSILMDETIVSNLYAIRYVVICNVKWKVEYVEIQYPRVKLTIGGVFNG